MRAITRLRPVHDAVPGAITELLRPAPLSRGKVAFAWRAAVGPAVDRATTIDLRAEGVLEVRAADAQWRREIERSASIILARLERMLGAAVVSRLSVRSRA